MKIKLTLNPDSTEQKLWLKNMGMHWSVSGSGMTLRRGSG